MGTSVNASERIDSVLDTLFLQWNGLDAIAATWDQYEPLDREVFHLEWSGITGSLMTEIEKQESELNAAQKQRWQELLELVNAKQPMLRRMLAS